ncbi:amidohydrolase family protein (plasmid) [Nocardioides sp. R1-1]|uniref:amidohydrolase family protein n=1 Tax=Nocardioides sp. R1-1 TaxID=3383502 RepID=UPI0038D00EDA
MPTVAIVGGRVIDPASSTDAVANVRIVDGVVAEVTSGDLPDHAQDIVIDATGRVVCPGFVDVHVHAHDHLTQSLMVRNGVTTALELELGSAEVPAFNERLTGRSLVHFGASAGYGYLRTLVQTGITQSKFDTALPESEVARLEELARERVEPADVRRVHDLVAEQLEAGAIGIGLGLEYVQGADQVEVLELFEQAARLGAAVFVHTREWPNADRGTPLGAMQEVIACAASTGAHAHICHVSSKGLDDTPAILRAIAGARVRGVPLSVEVPSVAGATGKIGSALFSEGWTKRWNCDYSALEWPPTGERLDQATFERLRAEQPTALVMKHITPESAVEVALQDPTVIVASDAVPVAGGQAGNPRAGATFSRVLGHYVRERGLLSLSDAIWKMTLGPAKLLEPMCADAARKGRLTHGADGDVVVFDPTVVAVRATVQQPDAAPVGISDVLVAGEPVVRAGELIDGVHPGRALRGRLR